MSEHFTRAQDERLRKVNEEAGEIVQAYSKLISYGSTTTFDGITYQNIDDFTKECGDILSAIERLIQFGQLDPSKLMEYKRLKSQSVLKYLRHQDDTPVNNLTFTLL